MTFIKLTATEN